MKGGKKELRSCLHDRQRGVCSRCVASFLFFLSLKTAQQRLSLCAEPLLAPTTVRADGSIYLRLCV